MKSYIVLFLMIIIFQLEASWSEPKMLSVGVSEGFCHKPKVAMNNKEIIVLWSADGSIFVSSKRNDREWTKPKVISTGFIDEFCLRPSLVMNEKEAIVAWSSDYNIYTSSKKEGGDWSAPVKVSRDDSFTKSMRVRIAINSKGTAIVAWSADNKVYASTRINTGWDDPIVLAKDLWPCQPSVVLNTKDEAFVSWYTEYSPNDIYVCKRGVDGSWGERLLLTKSGRPNGTSKFPCMVMNSSGQGIITGLQTHGRYNALVFEKNVDSEWGTSVVKHADNSKAYAQLSTGAVEGNCSFPIAAINEKGNAIVVWQGAEHPRSLKDIYVSNRNLQGKWERQRRISNSKQNTSDAFDPQVAVNSRGVVAVTWIHGSPGSRSGELFVSIKDQSKDWTAPQKVRNEIFSPGMRRPSISMNDSKIAIAWCQDNNIFISTLDKKK